MKYHQRDIVEVKCQIIAGYVERDILRRLGSVKERYFNEIVDKTIESIF